MMARKANKSPFYLYNNFNCNILKELVPVEFVQNDPDEFKFVFGN